jgi:hypothetical protein
MILITGNITGAVVYNCGRTLFKFVPDGGTFAVFVRGAFNLITCCRRSPDKVLGEISFHSHNISLEKIFIYLAR